ncbi:MAG: lipase family protein, partial [Solirubrobacteraceae bacterium]|nr:lipase family protein [Solirubrobacteraceae bacterium]
MRRTLIALAATTVAASAAVPQAANAEGIDILSMLPKPTYGAFYIPPDPLPPGKPGDIIRWQPMDMSKAITKTRRGVKGYLVMYRSTSAIGEPIAVTGTVLIPHEDPKQGAANRPLISYGNEAQGLGDNCAVSRLMRFGHTGEIALTEPMLKRGYAVASTDYEGLGTKAVHTFGVTVSSAHSMLDMARAARNLEVAKLPKDGKLALYGYSQGGAAVGMAAEIAGTYAPELDISAAAMGGAPIEPYTFSKFNDGGVFASVNVAAAAGYDAAYPDLKLRDMLNPYGEKIIDKTYNSCIEQIFPLANTKASSFLKDGLDIYKDPRWIARLNENEIGNGAAPTMPVYNFHALGDQAAPYAMATRLRRKWCGEGVQLRHVGLYVLEHVSAGPVWMPQAAKWVQARIEGKPDKGNCGYSPLIKAKEAAAAAKAAG